MKQSTSTLVVSELPVILKTTTSSVKRRAFWAVRASPCDNQRLANRGSLSSARERITSRTFGSKRTG